MNAFRSAVRTGLISIIILLTGACQPLAATVLPTPQIVNVQYTPALDSWTRKLNTCSNSLPDLGLVIHEIPANLLDPTGMDFALRFGPQDSTVKGTPPPFFASILATDEVVLAVNLANSQTNLTPQMISDIYTGQITTWDEQQIPLTTLQPTSTGQQIQVWAYPPGDDIRLVFDQAFMQGKRPSSQTYLAPDANAMLEALSENPDAIGYLLKTQLNSSIREITVDGAPAISLIQPILALSIKEPGGLARQMLLCLQGK